MKHILFLAIALLSLTGCMKEKPTALRWATFNIRYDNPQDTTGSIVKHAYASLFKNRK